MAEDKSFDLEPSGGQLPTPLHAFSSELHSIPIFQKETESQRGQVT